MPAVDLVLAVRQIQFARRYTSDLLSDVPEDHWFEMPGDLKTHIAWQVGHLAVAQYALALLRRRGEQPADEALMPALLRQCFGRGSVPSPDPAHYPSPADIRAVFDRVHEQALAELSCCDGTGLDELCERPHRIAKTKLESILWCSQHELIHAGQIGLLRRLMGRQPQW